MAIMRRCCCCGVRGGSIAAAIYSMITSVLSGADCALGMIAGNNQRHWYIFGQNAIGIIINLAVIFASIILLVGIAKNWKEMLVPFMIIKGIHIWNGYYMGVHNFQEQLANAFGYGHNDIFIPMTIALVIAFFIFAIDVVFLVCVIARYQEYNEGNGRVPGVSTAQAETTFITHQQSAPHPIAFPSQQNRSSPPSYVPLYKEMTV